MRTAKPWTRRTLLQTCTCLAVPWPAALAQTCDGAPAFIAAAAAQRDAAVAAGDQPYGAVLVLEGCIVGYGPSRVVRDRNHDAHAERVALWDAQQRLGRRLVQGATIFSTSIPCGICQPVLAAGGVTRMYVGPTGADRGPPRAA
jgi:tRNA(Arg) A34 adenosine deaminase TadA